MSSPRAERPFGVLTVYLHAWKVCFSMFITQSKRKHMMFFHDVFLQERYRLKNTRGRWGKWVLQTDDITITKYKPIDGHNRSFLLFIRWYSLYTAHTWLDVSPCQLNLLHMSLSGFVRQERGKQTSQINEIVSEIASVPAKSLLGVISPHAGIAVTWRDSGWMCYENEMLTCLQGWTGVWRLSAHAS